MIALGLAAALLAAIVVVILLPPLRQRPAERGAAELAVYRDQLAEVDRDLARGLLSDAEAAGARLEVERRLLKAAEAGRAPGDTRPPARLPAILLVLLVPAVALLVYLEVGAPALPDMPFSARSRPAEPKEVAEFAALVDRLAARLEEHPDDARGWTMLGRAQRLLGRPQPAETALARAIALLGGEQAAPPDLVADRAELLVEIADGVVTPAAVDAFEAVHARAPDQPKARFYLGLASYQAGDRAGALSRWRALAADSPPGAPWRPMLEAQIRAVAKELGEPADIPAPKAAPAPDAEAPGPGAADVEAAAKMSPEERAAFIRSMVDGLAARLAAAPDDPAGWLRLGRAYTVLGEKDKAQQAFGEAIRRLPEGSSERAEAERQRDALR